MYCLPLSVVFKNVWSVENQAKRSNKFNFSIKFNNFYLLPMRELICRNRTKWSLWEPGEKSRLRLKTRDLTSNNMSGVWAGCSLWLRERRRSTHSEVRDALEDLVKETVGAMELTEDYYTHRHSCHTHAHTHLEHNVYVCVCCVCRECIQYTLHSLIWCITTSGTARWRNVIYVDNLSFLFWTHSHLYTYSTRAHTHTNRSILIHLWTSVCDLASKCVQ